MGGEGAREGRCEQERRGRGGREKGAKGRESLEGSVLGRERARTSCASPRRPDAPDALLPPRLPEACAPPSAPPSRRVPSLCPRRTQGPSRAGLGFLVSLGLPEQTRGGGCGLWAPVTHSREHLKLPAF